MSKLKGKPGRLIERASGMHEQVELKGTTSVPAFDSEDEARDFILVSAADAFRLVLELMDSDLNWNEKHVFALEALDALYAVSETCAAMAGNEAREEAEEEK